MYTHIIMSITTEVAIRMFSNGGQPPARHRPSTECAKGRVIPHLPEPLFVEIAHCKSTPMAGQNITINPDTSMKPCNIAWLLLPYRKAYLITSEGISDVML